MTKLNWERQHIVTDPESDVTLVVRMKPDTLTYHWWAIDGAGEEIWPEAYVKTEGFKKDVEAENAAEKWLEHWKTLNPDRVM